LGHLSDNVLGKGADYVDVRGGFGVNPLPVDKVLVYFGGEGAFIVLLEHF